MQKYKYYVYGTGDIDMPSFQNLDEAKDCCYSFLEDLHILDPFYVNGGLVIMKAIYRSSLQDFSEDDTPATIKCNVMLPVE